MQGKIDYRFAALAARVLYDEMLSRGIRVFEYTPAFLHAKVAAIDDNWATVGSSNIDPLSLWLNLEANVVVRHEPFVAELSSQLDDAFSQSVEVSAPPLSTGWRARLIRWLVASVANTYLRLAGMNSRY
jgi:cardiolipin synthase